MQRLKLYALLLMSGLLLFLSGCQKDIVSDEFYSGQNKIINPGKIIKISSVRPIEKFIKKLASEKGNRNAGFTIDNVDTTRILKVEFTPEYSTYTMNIIHNEPGKIYNLVFKEENGVMYQPSVIEYHGTPEWVTKYNAGQANFDQFQGTFGQYRFSSKFASGLRNGEIDCDCFKTWVSLNGLNGGTSGNGGGSSDGITIGSLTFGGFNTGFPNISSSTGTSGTSGTSTTGTSTGNTNKGIINISNFAGCPIGYVPVWIPPFGFYCLYTGFGFAGATNGPREPDGEMETLDNINLGTRDDEKCINLIQGIGMLGNNDNRINVYAETLNPFVSQLSSCINHTIEAKIHELKSLAIIDACSGDNINVNVENLAMGLCFGCGKDGVGLTPQSLEDAFYEELEGMDYVDDSQISDNLCRCVYSIWKQMKIKIFTSGTNENECINDILGDFLEGPLQAEIGVSSVSLGENKRAITLPNTSNLGVGNQLLLYNSRIEINMDLCGNSINLDPIQVAGALLHEFVHARIYEHLYNKGYHSNLKTMSYDAAWNLFIQTHYPNIQPVDNEQHQLMAQAFTNDIAHSLWELNGKVGLPSDYLMIAWEGLQNAYPPEDRHKYDFIPNFDQLKNDFETNVQGKGILSFNGCN
ncbi:MAG: hypothetical protein IPM42_13450 [Saprospiraceae bacterium]|nr:hypothetical protein [Saprospiraceae bacterium]